MILFAVRHTKTGNLLPQMRGASHWEGESGLHPRLFSTERAARNFIIQWAKGIHRPIRTVYAFEEDYEGGGIEIQDVGRVRSTCQIVKFNLTEITE